MGGTAFPVAGTGPRRPCRASDVGHPARFAYLWIVPSRRKLRQPLNAAATLRDASLSLAPLPRPPTRVRFERRAARAVQAATRTAVTGSPLRSTTSSRQSGRQPMAASTFASNAPTAPTASTASTLLTGVSSNSPTGPGPLVDGAAPISRRAPPARGARAGPPSMPRASSTSSPPGPGWLLRGAMCCYRRTRNSAPSPGRRRLLRRAVGPHRRCARTPRSHGTRPPRPCAQARQ